MTTLTRYVNTDVTVEAAFELSPLVGHMESNGFVTLALDELGDH